MSRGRILLVEDRPSLARMLEQALAGEGYEVVVAMEGERGVALAAGGEHDLVLTDLKLPGASGLDVVAACRARRPPVPVVVMTAYGTVQTAVAALKQGALDFLEKPVELDDLLRLVAGVLGREGAAPPFHPPGGSAIVGSHPRLKAAVHLLEKVAPLDATVLLLGESGTGKELFAQALHALSPRRAGPFVAVNCAAIPESLVENELFGHEKGSFTGAVQRQAGRFEQARGGTILLDEIGELALSVQAKVLRVLEERTFERIGGGLSLKADVRLVAATNRNLAQMVAEGTFRQDLFFRLDVFPISLPPLRERRSDIPALARHLLAALGQRLGKAQPTLTDEACGLLAGESWPGNVRQLSNLLERALILAPSERLSRNDLEAVLTPAAVENEREQLRRALVDTQGDKKAAAQRLGWSYRTLLRKVREHDLEGVPQYR